MIAEKFRDMCNCELRPIHSRGEHDWCCQICGGAHTERLCPLNQCPMKEPCSNVGGCIHEKFEECDLYRKIKSENGKKAWAKGLHWKSRPSRDRDLRHMKNDPQKLGMPKRK
jgi:hypothetical protein